MSFVRYFKQILDTNLNQSILYADPKYKIYEVSVIEMESNEEQSEVQAGKLGSKLGSIIECKKDDLGSIIEFNKDDFGSIIEFKKDNFGSIIECKKDEFDF